MSLDDRTRAELQALLYRICEGQATAEDQLRLESLVSGDPAACEYYIRYMQLHGALLLETTPLRGVLPDSADTANADVSASGANLKLPSTVSRSPVLGFLHRMLRIDGESPLAAALTWMVMAILLSGTVLTAVFIGLMMFGAKPPAGHSSIAKSEDRKAGNLTQQIPLSPPAVTSSSPVARLIRVVDCHWGSGSKTLKSGDDLAPGRELVLKSGLAEIVFQGGARTVLQGPATLKISSRMSAFLHDGRFSVTVENPLARGFEVHTPGMKYTDLGTEFGVFVAADGEQQVHVFRGTVEVEEVADDNSMIADRKPGTEDAEPAPAPQGVQSVTGSAGSHPSSPASPRKKIVLSANEAIRVAPRDAAGKKAAPMERVASKNSQFVRTDQLNQIAGANSPEFIRWKKFSDELCKRPDLVAYYDFQADEADRAVLRNRAASGKKLDGRIEGAKWTDGRLLGKQVLEFSGSNDRVRLNLPDRLTALTAVVWVRVDSLPNKLNSILESEGWYDRIGACHWQFDSNPWRVTFHVAKTATTDDPPPNSQAVVHPASVDASDLHSWRQFAVVYDSMANTTEFYGDGKPIGSVSGGEGVPAVFGPSQIANWQPTQTKKVVHPVRNLPAQISELFILSQALKPEEIKGLYDAGFVEPAKEKSGN
jgi:hypothetical protein